MNQKNYLISLEKELVGYLEKASPASEDIPKANPGYNNYTIFGAEYGLDGQPWCHMVQSIMMRRAGLVPNLDFPFTASCGVGVQWFRARGLWIARGSAAPEAGMMIYFTEDGKTACHVGLVSAVSGSLVYTLEGNTNPQTKSDRVEPNGGGFWNKAYSLGSGWILGYGIIKYNEEIEIMVTKQDMDNWYDEKNPMYKTVADIPDQWLRSSARGLVQNGIINGGAAPYSPGEDLDTRPVNMRRETLIAVVAALRR